MAQCQGRSCLWEIKSYFDFFTAAAAGLAAEAVFAFDAQQALPALAPFLQQASPGLQACSFFAALDSVVCGFVCAFTINADAANNSTNVSFFMLWVLVSRFNLMWLM